MCNDMQYGIYGHLHFPGTITSSFAVIRSAGFKLSLMYDKNTYWYDTKGWHGHPTSRLQSG